MSIFEKYQQHLKNVVQFWFRARDDENGGYHFNINSHGVVKPSQRKPLVIQSRLLYSFSEGMEAGVPGAADHAAHAYKCLSGTLKQKSGWYDSYPASSVTGKTGKKDLYENIITLIGLARYARTTGERKYLAEAEELLHLLESECIIGSMAENGLVGPANPENQGARYYAAHCPLHYLEALTILKRTGTTVNIESRVAEIRRFFYEKLFIKELSITIDLFKKTGWDTPCKGYGVYAYPSHSLEWIIYFRCFPKHVLDTATETALFDYVSEKCITEEGIFMIYFYLTEQKASHGGMYWPQTDGVHGYHLAEKLYPGKYTKILELLEKAYFTYFVDNDSGIFNKVGANAVVIRADKGNEWKCDFHSVRMCRGVMDLNT